jgi:hypothetical protein
MVGFSVQIYGPTVPLFRPESARQAGSRRSGFADSRETNSKPGVCCEGVWETTPRPCSTTKNLIDNYQTRIMSPERRKDHRLTSFNRYENRAAGCMGEIRVRDLARFSVLLDCPTRQYTTFWLCLSTLIIRSHRHQGNRPIRICLMGRLTEGISLENRQRTRVKKSWGLFIFSAPSPLRRNE